MAGKFYKELGKVEDVTGPQALPINSSHLPFFLEVSGTGSMTVTYTTPGGHEKTIPEAEGYDLATEALYISFDVPVGEVRLDGDGTYSATAGY